MYHAQSNSSPDFSDTEGIDWFVEGLAAYASGQPDTLRLKEIKKAIVENKIPASLDSFLRYGLPGSIVLFIDDKWARVTLKRLFVSNKKTATLSTLNLQEATSLDEWKAFTRKL